VWPEAEFFGFVCRILGRVENQFKSQKEKSIKKYAEGLGIEKREGVGKIKGRRLYRQHGKEEPNSWSVS
jgi:hypothetical protein